MITANFKKASIIDDSRFGKDCFSKVIDSQATGVKYRMQLENKNKNQPRIESERAAPGNVTFLPATYVAFINPSRTRNFKCAFGGGGAAEVRPAAIPQFSSAEVNFCSCLEMHTMPCII